MTLVLDTNVVVSALLWGGQPRLLIEAALAGRVFLFSSVPMLEELTGVLARAKFAPKIAASGMGIDDIVDGYAALAQIVRPAAGIIGIAPDPDDDVVIATALASGARAVVTGDGPLLAVGRYEGVAVIRVAEAVELIG